MNTNDFDYELPLSFIAQTPVEPRDHSRLLALNCTSGELEHRFFYQIGEFLRPGDLLVVNTSRVIPARLYARKLPGGGKVEVLLLKKLDDLRWECLVGGEGMKLGRVIAIEDGPQASVEAVLEASKRVLCFSEAVEPFLEQAGHVPLPPYIHGYAGDPERYQTVYNRTPGSAAAPTAGLHFTLELMESLKQMGVSFASVSLQVGLDTFSPVKEEDPREHRIHREYCELSEETAKQIRATKAAGGRVIAVGTTSVRTLESAATESGVRALAGETGVFILPGYHFKLVDAMITNFHLPKSTLLMLVSAFAGREQILHAYEVAKQEGYRFFSFGDAMFLGRG